MSENKVIDVAVGVLCRSDKTVLFARRPEGKEMAGYWEFPGGKIERGESVHEALVRELQEEIGVHIKVSKHWQTIEHIYPHAHVLLHFQIVRDWLGDPYAKEGQTLLWKSLMVNTNNQVVASEVEPVLPATLPLLESLAKII